VEGAVRANPNLLSAINIDRGRITHAAVAEAFSLEHRPWQFESSRLIATGLAGE
jgi:alanine dehydrogenase